MDTLEQIQTLADGLYPTSDPDELGKLDRIIRTLTAVKRTSMVELEGPVTGTEYRIAEQNKATRSYNTASLVKAFDDKGWNLNDLLIAGAARIQWQWTNLRRAANQADVTLSVASHELEDEGELSDEMVGEVWSSYYKIEGAS